MDLLGKACASAPAYFRWGTGVPPDSKLGTDVETTKQEMQLLSLSLCWLECYGLCRSKSSSYTPQVNTTPTPSYKLPDSLVLQHLVCACPGQQVPEILHLCSLLVCSHHTDWVTDESDTGRHQSFKCKRSQFSTISDSD